MALVCSIWYETGMCRHDSNVGHSDTPQPMLHAPLVTAAALPDTDDTLQMIIIL